MTALALALLLVAAPPAAAAGGGSTDTARIDPATVPAGVHLEVWGGDVALALRVEPGHAITIPGYQGEPWLEVEADGTVRENQRAPTHIVNATLDGSTPLPPDVSVEATPRWEVVSTDGTFEWHDHRIHDMGAFEGRGPGLLTAWAVPLTVDGNPVTVRGELVRPESPPTPALVAASLTLGLATWAWLRTRPLGSATVAVPLAGALAAVAALAGAAGEARLPGGVSPGSWLAAGLGIVGIAMGVAARRAGHREDGRAAASRALIGLGATACSLVLQGASWQLTTLHTVLPAALDRALVVSAAGLTLGVAATLVLSGLGLSLPDPGTTEPSGSAGPPTA